MEVYAARGYRENQMSYQRWSPVCSQQSNHSPHRLGNDGSWLINFSNDLLNEIINPRYRGIVCS